MPLALSSAVQQGCKMFKTIAVAIWQHSTPFKRAIGLLYLALVFEPDASACKASVTGPIA